MVSEARLRFRLRLELVVWLDGGLEGIANDLGLGNRVRGYRVKDKTWVYQAWMDVWLVRCYQGI